MGDDVPRDILWLKAVYLQCLVIGSVILACGWLVYAFFLSTFGLNLYVGLGGVLLFILCFVFAFALPLAEAGERSFQSRRGVL